MYLAGVSILINWGDESSSASSAVGAKGTYALEGVTGNFKAKYKDASMAVHLPLTIEGYRRERGGRA